MAELSPQQTSRYYWLAFTKTTTEAEARAAFRARYGHEPQSVGISLGNVLAGPVPTWSMQR
jgi:hypothetical protein